MPSSSSNSALVLDLAEEFLERYRQGERPALREYIDKHPHLAAEIREVFPAMAMMENIALGDESLAGSGLASGGFQAPKALERLGDYRIIREVGRGGMGVVYEAEQVSLGRHVALKVLPNKAHADDRQKRRFEREAKAAAKLHHTNIVPVFGVGEQDGLPFYVMQFIQGLGMNDVLEELRHLQGQGTPAATGEMPVLRRNHAVAEVAMSLLTGRVNLDASAAEDDGAPSPGDGTMTFDRPASAMASKPAHTVQDLTPPSGSISGSSVVLPGQSDDGKRAGKRTYWQSVANIGFQVANALDYAHQQGILHRDIKPSNLLLDTRGTVWVTDFGLAKTDDQQNLTTTGDILGTLRYMPPEAFEGHTDRRGDVYALGLTLYELLALKPAFGEKDRHKLIKQVTSTEVQRLDTVNAAIPRDLVTVIHKATDRDPAHRYPNAGEMAADLRRYLDDEPIHARRLSALERCGRWCRRNPLVASLIAAVVLVTGIGFAATLSQMRAAQDHAEQANLSAAEARTNAVALTKQIEVTNAANVNLREARDEAERQKLLVQKALDEVDASYNQLLKTQTFLQAAQNSLNLSLVPAAWEAGNVPRVLDLLERCRPAPGGIDLRGFEWHYWMRQCHGEVEAVKLPTVPKAQGFGQPTLSGDGRRVGLLSRDLGVPIKQSQMILTIFESATGNELMREPVGLYQAGGGPALGGKGGAGGFGVNAARLSFSRDGSLVVVEAPSSGKNKKQDQPPGTVISQKLQVFDVETGENQGGPTSTVFREQQGPLKAAALPGPFALSPTGSDLAFEELDFDSAGPAGAPRNAIKLWSVADRKATVVFRPDPKAGRVGLLAFSDDGTKLAAVLRPLQITAKEQPKTTVVVWDAKTGTELYNLSPPGAPGPLVFAPDGKHIALGYARTFVKGVLPPSDARVDLINLDSGMVVRPFAFPLPNNNTASGVITPVFSVDGKLLAATASGSANARNQVVIWEVATGQLRSTLEGHGSAVYGAAFDLDGKHIRTIYSDGTVKLWALPTVQAPFQLPNFPAAKQGGVKGGGGKGGGGFASWARSLAVNRAFQLVAVSESWLGGGPLAGVDEATNAAVHVFDMAGRKLRVFEKHTGVVTRMTFAPDDDHVASISNAGGQTGTGETQVLVWSTSTGRGAAGLNQKHKEGGAALAEFSPDGKHLAVAWQKQKAVSQGTGKGATWPPSATIAAIVGSLATGDVRGPLQAASGHVAGTTVSSLGVTVTYWGTALRVESVEVWDIERQQRLWVREEKETGCNIYGLSWTADGRWLTSGYQTYDPFFGPGPGSIVELYVLDAATGKRQSPWAEDAALQNVAIDLTGARVAAVVGASDPKEGKLWLKLWDLAAGAELVAQDLGRPTNGWGYRLGFSPDGKSLAATLVRTFVGGAKGAKKKEPKDPGKDFLFKLWDTATWMEKLSVAKDKKDIAAINSYFSPDGKTLVVSHDYYLTMANGNIDIANSVFGGGGFGGGGGGKGGGGGPGGVRVPAVKLYDTATCEELPTLRSHADPIDGLVFAPDRKRLATWSYPRFGSGIEVKLWDVTTGFELLTLTIPTGISGLAFTPDGHQLIGSAFNGAPITIWDATPVQEGK